MLGVGARGRITEGLAFPVGKCLSCCIKGTGTFASQKKPVPGGDAGTGTFVLNPGFRNDAWCLHDELVHVKRGAIVNDGV